MSSPANEHGGHARPRGHVAPRPPDSRRGQDAPRPRDSRQGQGVGEARAQRDTAPAQGGLASTQADTPSARNRGYSAQAGVPYGQNGMPSAQNGSMLGQFGAVPGQNGAGTGPRPVPPPRPAPGRGRHGVPSQAAGPSRKPSSAARRPRRSRRSRIAALAIVVTGVLVTGLAAGFGTEASAEPTAQAFLFDWQQRQFAAAGALTTAAPGTVAAGLRGAFAQLDAAQLFLSMKSVSQHGDTADASFTATVDLAQQPRVWTYQGHFSMRRLDGDWKVEWAPSVVNPSLGQGERLAVVTQFPPRASVLDAGGDPLQLPAPAYVLGVWPDRLYSQAVTARAFADLTKMQPAQVLGQITAAPPDQFLPLATLDSASYANLRDSLQDVPGLVVRPESRRLYQAEAAELVGEVGSEINERLRADGALYVPGTTVGLSGLERAYQRQLLGTPATEVVVVNAAGAQTDVLASWPGTAGTPLRTTISSGAQNAALAALGHASGSGEIVAMQASTGDVLAVAQHKGSGALPAAGALDAKLVPGNAFTIVSAAALVGAGTVSASTPISCTNSFNVGGQTFTAEGTGEQKPFSTAFAEGCSTALVQLSERLSASQWAQTVREFGIGSGWSLPVPAFSGAVPSTAGQADLAAQMIGQGNVRMSPLSMAAVAATVDAGRFHAPQVIQAPAGTPAAAGSALDPGVLSALRGLMRGAVRSGAAKAAGLPGAQVYGQVGMVRTDSGWMSWFVGYRGDIAVAAVESGTTAHLSAAALARAFFAALR